jgi:hypothetical protein
MRYGLCDSLLREGEYITHINKGDPIERSDYLPEFWVRYTGTNIEFAGNVFAFYARMPDGTQE